MKEVFHGYVPESFLKSVYPEWRKHTKGDRILVEFNRQPGTVVFAHKKFWFRYGGNERLVTQFIRVQLDEPYNNPGASCHGDMMIGYHSVYRFQRALIRGTPDHDLVPWKPHPFKAKRV